MSEWAWTMRRAWSVGCPRVLSCLASLRLLLNFLLRVGGSSFIGTYGVYIILLVHYSGTEHNLGGSVHIFADSLPACFIWKWMGRHS